MSVIVRRLRADEGPVLRDLRLRSLRDAPYAFSKPLAEIEARRDDEWAAVATRRARSDHEVTFVAERDGAFVGMIGGFAEAPGVVDVVAMWTDPAARRTGVASALVAAVVDWARAIGAATATLGVSVGNDAAERLYESVGFRRTGEIVPMPHDPSMQQQRMERPLRASPHAGGDQPASRP